MNAKDIPPDALVTPPPCQPISYRPPLEKVCRTCGGKHVGSCPFNACNERN